MNGLDVASLWLADFHLLAALLLAVVLLVAWRLRQPARRMAVAKATLAALATLAVLTALPGWSLVHLLSADRAPTTIEQTAALPTELPPSRVLQLDPAPPAPTTPTIGAKSHAAPVAARPLPAAFTWTPLLLAVYAAGSLLVVAWLAMGSLLARRVRRGAVAAPAELYELLAAVTGKSAKLPALLVSDRIAAPVALGVRRPAIILPTSMLSSTDDVDRAELAAVLAHEWSHLQNGDLQTLAASRLLLVLLWLQPLFWLLRRALRLDQETLADADAAALAGRVPYAERLLSWAKQMNNADSSGAGTPRLAGAVGLWEGPSQLKRRIAVLLDERFTILRQCSRRWRWTCGALIAAAAIGLSLVTWQPATEANAKPPAEPPVSRDAEAERAATDTSPTKGQPEEVGIRVFGRCINAAGDPVAGARLWLPLSPEFLRDAMSTPETMTNSTGEFTFLLPNKVRQPTGRLQLWTIWAWADGHALATASCRDAILNDDESPIEIRLGAAADTAFQVLDMHGSPVPSAALEPWHVPRGEIVPETLRKLAGGVTNVEGWTQMPGIAPSDLRSVRVLTGDLTAQHFNLKYGSDAKSKRTLKLAETGGIAGQVVGSADAKVSGIPIFVITKPSPRAAFGNRDPREFAAMPEGYASAETDENGRFEIDAVATGRAELHAYVDLDLAWRIRPAAVFEVLAGDAVSVELPLEKAVRVHGIVCTEDTQQPVPNAQVHIRHGAQRPPFVTEQVITDAQGRYEARVLPGPVQPYVQSLPKEFADWQDMSHRRWASLEVPDASEHELPALELERMVTIVGMLFDQHDRPLPDTRLYGVEDNRIYGHTMSDHGGEFTMRVPKSVKIQEYVARKGSLGDQQHLELEVTSENPLKLRVAAGTGNE